jgi:26S proteasome regulatory subunit N9
MAAPAKPSEALRSIFSAHSDLDQQVCRDLISLYDRKLYHELSLKLRAVFDDPAFAPYIQDIFERFVSDFGFRMNLLATAQLAHDVAKRMDRDTAVVLLEGQARGMQALVGVRSEEPRLLLSMSVAEHQLGVAKLDECKAALDAGLAQLDTLSEVCCAAVALAC